MGSNHGPLNGNEVQEVTHLIEAFEHMNRVELSFTLGMRREGTKRQLAGLMAAWPEGRADTVLTPSDYKSVRCWANEYKSLMALVTGLLYKLDFELGSSEWEKIKPKL